MVTLLEVIQRTPSIVQSILDTRKEKTKDLMDYLGGKVREIDEFVFIGSGTSGTCAMSSRGAVERVSGLRSTVSFPNEFYTDRAVRNKNALYIFTSQSGNSILTRECMRKMTAEGYLTVGITEGPTTDIAKEAGVHVDMGCGFEEYGFRTIGYCASILTHIVIAMEIALAAGRLSQEDYDRYLADAYRVPESHQAVSSKTLAWFEKNKERLMDSTSYFFYGAGPLWGVALEGALKMLEITGRVAVGYELEEGLHGPTMAFNDKTCVISLNGGDAGSEKAVGLGKMCKNNTGKGFIMGAEGVDETDLVFDIAGGEFRALEFAPAVEILAYEIAINSGIDLMKPSTPPKESYFETHDFSNDPAKAGE
mgnify:CR=1 FL=1